MEIVSQKPKLVGEQLVVVDGLWLLGFATERILGDPT